jgi:predicted ferric reductase
LCEAVLFLTYVVATKMWICLEFELWNIIHILVFITANLLLLLWLWQLSNISCVDLCGIGFRKMSYSLARLDAW